MPTGVQVRSPLIAWDLPTLGALGSSVQTDTTPRVASALLTSASVRIPFTPAMYRRRPTNLPILILVAILGAEILFAAGDGERRPSTSSPVDLVVVFKSDPDYTKVFEDTADVYTRSYENVSIELVDIPEWEYEKRLQSMIESGVPIDVVNVDWSSYATVDGHLLDLRRYMGNEYLDEDEGLYQGWLDMFASDGSFERDSDDPIFQAPLSTGTTVLAYNPILFEQAEHDLPATDWTWDKLWDAARIVQEKTDATWGIANVDAPFLPYAVVASYGGQLVAFDADGQPTFGGMNTETIDALQTLKNLMYKDHVAPTPDEQLHIESALEAFKDGRAAMYFLNTSEFPELYSFPDWDIQALPKGPSGVATTIYGERVAVVDSSRNPEHAWGFIDLLNSGTGQAAIDTYLGVADPALQRVARLSRFREGRAGAPNHYSIRTDVLKNSDITVSVYPNPNIPNASQVHDVLENAIRLLWSDEDTTAADVMSSAAHEITPLLGTR